VSVEDNYTFNNSLCFSGSSSISSRIWL